MPAAKEHNAEGLIHEAATARVEGKYLVMDSVIDELCGQGFDRDWVTRRVTTRAAILESANRLSPERDDDASATGDAPASHEVVLASSVSAEPDHLAGYCPSFRALAATGQLHGNRI